VAVVTVAWLALLVGPAQGVVRGSTRLSAPDVSPRSGTTKTVVAFTVVYRNREGSPPDWVRVTVAGATHLMRALDPLDRVKEGVRYSYRAKLPVGTHSVSFSSRGRDKFQDSLAAGKVTIKAPSTGSSGGSGGSGGGGSGGGGSGGGSSGSAGSSGSGRAGSGDTSGSSGTTRTPPGGSAPSGQAPTFPIVPVLVSPLELEPLDPQVSWSPGGEGAPGAVAPGAGAPVGPPWSVVEPVDPGSAPETGAGGGRGGTDAVRIPGVRLPGSRPEDLLATTLLTSAVTTVVIAFLVFGKRKRDEEQPAPDGELAQAAAMPFAFAPAGPLAYAPATVTRSVPAYDPGTGGTDVDLPRWRRPSLLAARKYDPLRDPGTATHLTFDGSATAGGAHERRIVRYRIVRLLDRPDELAGVELGTLDEGDEVEIVEQRGTYRRVLTPDGREGWVHKMTLGELVGDGDAAAAADPDIDADVLLAYLAARARN